MASFANNVITYLDASRNFLLSSLTDTTLYPSFIKELLAIYNALKSGEIDKVIDLQNRFMLYADVLWQVVVAPLFEYLMQEKRFCPCCFRKNDPIDQAEKIPSIERCA